MAGEPDKKSGSSEKFSEQLRGAQRLASRLQRAIRLGRTTRQEMREVDRYVSGNLTTRMANTLDAIDTLLHRAISIRSKEMLGQIYIDLMGLFSEFRSLEAHGYSTLVQTGGMIDSTRLDKLIDLDGELSSYISRLESKATGLNGRSRFSKTTRDQIRQLMDIITELLERRRLLIESG